MLERLLKNHNTPLVMGVLNVTPDSFSDGGQFFEISHAIEHALEMVEQGADIIDVGGESTRPGAEPVSVQEECRRVLPVIEALKKYIQTPISLDTRNYEVMAQAVALGVDWINDVYALQDERAVELVAKSKVSVCLYHCKGSPQIMQQAPAYEDVVRDVYDYLAARLDVCLTAGVAREKIILDPGFGFGKTLAHNLSLLKHLSAFKPLNCQLLAGLSRKSMFQHLLGRPVEARLPASLAAAVIAYQNGADIIRAHDVQATKDALTVAAAVMKYEENISHHD